MFPKVYLRLALQAPVLDSYVNHCLIENSIPDLPFQYLFSTTMGVQSLVLPLQMQRRHSLSSGPILCSKSVKIAIFLALLTRMQ